MRALIRSTSFTLPFLLLLPQAATAQATITLAKTIPVKIINRYAAESVVIDRDDWVYSVNADGTGYRQDTIAATVQTDAAVRQLGVISIGFASASEHVQIVYARVRHKDGSITQTPASEAIEQPAAVTQQAPFYSDLKQEELPIKDLQVGDTLEWQARIVRTKPQAPKDFWGSQDFIAPSDGVALEESVELRIPAASTATVWTDPRSGVKPVETIEGATRVYVWKTAQLNPTAGPEADAAKKAKKGKILTPDEELDAEEGRLPALEWTSFKSWADVGAWYRSLEGSRAVPNDDIKAKVASLTAGKTTEEDKVRAVYGYVSSQIHYIGVAFGVGRYQPHEADDVLQNQYGDCKDKATLLASMLEVLGLHPDSVLIGADVRMNQAVPSPAAFNHLINRVLVNGKEVWLDSTTEIAPYQVLVFNLRDKLALVIPEQGTATLERTPKSLPFTSVDTWKAVGTLNKDGISESHITLTMRGDIALAYREAAHEVSPGQYNDLVQRVVASLGYGGTVSNASFTRPDDTAVPFVMSFDYHREKAGDWADLRTLPQALPVELATVDESNPPVQTIMLGTPHTEISDAAMTLPAGWTAVLPEAEHYQCPWATYDMTYRFDKGTIYTERKLVILQRKVPASDWKAYKKWGDEVGIGQDPYIQLNRPDGSSTTTVTVSGTHEPNAAVKALYAQLDTAYNNKDPKVMEVLLKQMKSIDPNARRYWAYTAAMELLEFRASSGSKKGSMHKLEQAIKDNQKELRLYPDEMDRYEVIARMQQWDNDNEGTAATLQAWADADPENPKPELAFAALMMSEKNYSVVVTALNKAISLMGPEQAAKNETMQEVLGTAQIQAGMIAKGEATLVALLKSTDNPGTMNDAAYELADAKLDLQLDEQKAQTALDRMTTETQSWTLDEAPNLLHSKTSLLDATWDTMGWILFRQGKPKEAKTYIEAAMMGQPSSTVQGHLDAVNQTLGVSGKIPGPGSQEARTFYLGPSNGLKVVAEYKLLLSQGRAERAEPVGEKSIAGAEEMLRHVDFSMYFPAGSKAKLFKLGMINCYGKKCELVVE